MRSGCALQWQFVTAVCLVGFAQMACRCFGQAQFGSGVQRWGGTNADTVTTIALSSGITAGNIAVVTVGYEANYSMNLTSVSDSEGNTWTIAGSIDYSSVHRGALAWSYLTNALTANDTISIAWSNAPTSAIAKAGAVFYITGCSNSRPDVIIQTNSAGTNVTAPGAVALSGECLIGMMVVDQVLVSNYATTWLPISPPDLYGHSGHTDGLASYYFYTTALTAGKFNPGGSLQVTTNQIPSWGILWVGFKPLVAPITYYVDFANGSDINSGLSASAPWQHCPGDTNATFVAATTLLAPGSRVLFKGGVSYVGEVDVRWSGTAGLPITYDGNSSGSWGNGMAIMDCSTNFYHAIAAQHLLGSRDHIVINNFDIQHLKNVSNATQAVNTVQGSLDLPGTTNTLTFLGDNGAYSYGGVFVYGNDWVVSNCNIHESEQWWYRTLAIGNSVANVPCLQAGINIFTGTNVIITNCTFWAVGVDCIRAQGTNITISGCNMGGPNSLDLTNRGWFAVGVRAGGYLANSSIIQCLIHDGWQLEGDESKQRCHAGDWIHIYGNNNGVRDGGDPSQLLIDGCFMYNDKAFDYANGTGNIYLEQDVWDVTIRNCAVINPQHMGIWTSGGVVSNINILNNTFACYNPNSGGGAFAIFVAGTPKNVNVTNNLVVEMVNNSSVLPMIASASPPSSTIFSDYNIFYNPITANYGTVRYTNVDLSLAIWSASTGNDTHSLTNDPRMLSLPTTGAASSSGNYALASNSPAIGAGASLSAVVTDIEGNTRVSPWDIGAFKYQSRPPPPTNLRIIR